MSRIQFLYSVYSVYTDFLLFSMYHCILSLSIHLSLCFMMILFLLCQRKIHSLTFVLSNPTSSIIKMQSLPFVDCSMFLHHDFISALSSLLLSSNFHSLSKIILAVNNVNLSSIIIVLALSRKSSLIRIRSRASSYSSISSLIHSSRFFFPIPFHSHTYHYPFLFTYFQFIHNSCGG